MSFFLKISLLTLSLGFFLTHCAGKQVKKTNQRFVPYRYKTIYIGSIINFSSVREMGDLLKKDLEDHFKFSQGLKWVSRLKSADVYLDLEIRSFEKEVLFQRHPSAPHQRRLVLDVWVTMREVKTKNYYVKNKSLKLSKLYHYRQEGDFFAYKEALEKLFDLLSHHLDRLIETGQFEVFRQLGYEGLEDDTNKTWFERNSFFSNATLESEADFLQRKPQDLTIEERQDKIDQIDRKGLERN